MDWLSDESDLFGAETLQDVITESPGLTQGDHAARTALWSALPWAMRG